MKESYRLFFLDTVLSFTAFALPVFTIFFIIQPNMARFFNNQFSDGASRYGLALTLVAVAQFLDSSLIGSLSSIRLLRSLDDNTTNDARKSLASMLVFIIIIMSVGLLLFELYYGVLTWNNYIFTLVVMILISLFDYYIVEFRVKLNYREIVVANTILVFGYLVGFYIFTLCSLWQIIYILAYSIGSIYILFRTRIIQNINRLERPDRAIVKQYLKLAGANIMTYIVSYGDRIVLFPLFGPTVVSIYSSAAVASKAISLITKPLNSVVLSYLSRIRELRMTRKKLCTLCIVGMGLMSITVAIFIPISNILSRYLYPQWSNQSYIYIPIIVVQVGFLAFGEILNNIVLRLSNTDFQIMISIVRLILYIFGGIIASRMFGLFGYCVTSLVAEASRFIIVIYIMLRDSLIIEG